MIDPSPVGGGIRTPDLVVETSACHPTELSPSLPPSGTQNTLWYPNTPWYKIPSFFRVHLFVTTRVATRDGNFLIGAPFDSDRPRHLFFRPKKLVLGPVDVFRSFSTFFGHFHVFFMFFFWGDCANPGKKKVCWQPAV